MRLHLLPMFATATAFVVACGPVVPGASTTTSRSNAPAMLVPAAPIERGPIQQTVSYNGDVRATEQITVLPRASGRVQRVLVDVGSPVRAGDVLAELEQDSASIQLAQARANLAVATAKLTQLQGGPRSEDVTAAQESLAQQQTRLESLQAQGRPEDVAGARAALAAQQAKLQLMQQGGRAETVQQAQSALDQAEQKLTLLQKGATDDVRQAAISAVNSDKAAVVAAEAQYAAFGGTSAADLETLQNQVDTLQAQIGAAQSVVGSADAALRNQRNASQADVQAAQSAVDQAQAQLDAAQAALDQANNPPQASVAQAQAAIAQAQAQRRAAQANKTALDQSVAGVCAPMISPVTGTSIKNADGTACGSARDAAAQAIDAGERAVEAAQGQLDLLRRGGAPATQAALQAQVASAQANVKATRARLDALSATGVEAQRAQIQAQRDQAQSQLVAAQDSLATAQARLSAARSGVQDAQRKAAQAQVDAAREKLTADQKRLEQLVAGPQDEELFIAQDAVDQATQQLLLAQHPATPQDIAAQQALVDQARQALAKATQPFTSFDIQQQEHVVAAAAATFDKAQHPFTDQDLQAAGAVVDQARAQVDLAELGVKETRVVAPVDGMVYDRHVSPGAQVAPTSPIATLIPPSLDVVVNVDENQIANVRKGQSVSLSLTAYPDATFSGTVSALAPAVDQKSRTVAVHVQPQNIGDGRTLLPGMLAQVSIVTSQKQDALLVPRQALMTQTSPSRDTLATIVVVGSDNRVQREAVQLGLVNDNVAEVLGGVQPGQLVVTANALGLNSGDLVNPQVQPRTTAASFLPGR